VSFKTPHWGSQNAENIPDQTETANLLGGGKKGGVASGRGKYPNDQSKIKIVGNFLNGDSLPWGGAEGIREEGANRAATKSLDVQSGKKRLSTFLQFVHG